MIDKEFVKKKIELIREDLELLRDVEQMTFDELAKDPFLWNGVQHLLQKIIGRGIDINQHLIVELATSKLKAPLDYTETFIKLGELKVLPKNFAKKISKSAGFRNILVHEYNNINEQTVYRSVSEALVQYTKYCDYILNFLEKEQTKEV